MASSTFSFGSLFRDLGLLVVGIFLSLLLNDCRERRSDARDDQRLMEQLAADLIADTLALHISIAGLEEVENDFLKIDTSQNLSARSRVVWGVGTYYPFRPHRAALQEITYAGRADKLKRRELVSRVMVLHDGAYADLREVELSFQNYILNDFFPYLSDHLPVLGDLNNPAEKEMVVARSLEADALQNRLMILETLNWNNLIMAQQALGNARDILAELE